MYAKFFGLSQDPFSIAPDPRYLFMSERHREALAHLLFGLGGGGGFVLLSGEIGTGKTTVCRCFLEQIPANCNVAYIFNPKLSVPELLRSICDEFHIGLPQGATTAKDFIDPLNQFLLHGHAAGQNNVLIIDEAQNLSSDVLEQLRLLTNLETNERKLLQIVLIGQPELRSMLAQPKLEQLAQRVIARFHLYALSAEETAHYIGHRLAVAGMTGATPFDSKAIARVHQLARGVPRRINLLCGRTLLGAYASGMERIDRRMVNKAASEVFGPDQRSNQRADQIASARGTGTGGTARRRDGFWPVASMAVASLAGLLVGAALFGVATWTLQSRNVRDTSNIANAARTATTATASSPIGLAKATGAAYSAASGPSASAVPGVMPVIVSALVTHNSASSPSITVAEPAARPALDAVLLSRTDFNAGFASNLRTQNQAWQALGQVWGVVLDDQDACRTALQQRVYCFNSRQTPLSLIRELNRPGIVTLFNDNKHPTYAVLAGLTEQTATLRLGSQTHTVSLTVLAEIWRGDFATLWRASEGYSEKTRKGKVTPATDWLAAQLARVPGTPTAASAAERGAQPALEAALRARVYAFQLAHGLTPDGQAGPLTLMQLNRATGVDEPHLQSRKP